MITGIVRRGGGEARLSERTATGDKFPRTCPARAFRTSRPHRANRRRDGVRQAVQKSWISALAAFDPSKTIVVIPSDPESGRTNATRPSCIGLTFRVGAYS